jgi:hypothetical protein
MMRMKGEKIEREEEKEPIALTSSTTVSTIGASIGSTDPFSSAGCSMSISVDLAVG